MDIAKMEIQEINKLIKELNAEFTCLANRKLIKKLNDEFGCLTNRCPNCNAIHRTLIEAKACCFGWDLDNGENIE